MSSVSFTSFFTLPIESLKRSSALTKGYRWKIFGIFVIIAVVNVVAIKVLGRVLVIGGGPIPAIGEFVWRAIIGAFSSILGTVVYHDLRVAKEGIDIERIAAVFD